MKGYYNVNDVIKITGNKQSWCYECIRKLREKFLKEYPDAIIARGKIPIWYFESKMGNKKNDSLVGQN